MKFLVDAQLPWRLAGWLREAGHEARHTLELPLGNRTPDRDLVELAAREQCVMITKDSDFVQSFLLNGEPALLLISTGNIANHDLERLLRQELGAIERAFMDHRFVELRRDALVLHQ